MNVPDLQALQQGDPNAWDKAFRWLWPVALAAAQARLQTFLPGEIEDVAIEALEELVEKVDDAQTVTELKPLVASIAHHRAVSLLRERFAAKRGGGLIQSLERDLNHAEGSAESGVASASLAELEQRDLADLLNGLQAGLKLELRVILNDFFITGLRYEEIAAKHNLAAGTVGVYLRRGLEAIRQQRKRHPALLKELEEFLR